MSAPDSKTRRWIRPRAIAGLAVVALGVGGVVALSQRANAGDPDPTPSAAVVTTQKAAMRTLEETKLAPCALDYGAASHLAAGAEGTITRLPKVGQIIKPGKAIYAVDNKPVLLLKGNTPAWRDLAPGIDRGADITQLKKALASLKKYEFKSGERRDAWNPRLTTAVKSLQQSAGASKTGSLPLGSVVFVRSNVRVAGLDAATGARVSVGTDVLTWSGTTRQLTCQLASADRRFASRGAKVAVSFADGTTAQGTITSVAPAPAKPDAGDDGEEPGIVVRVSVPQGEMRGQLDGSSAQVTMRTVLAKDTLAVPVTALVAMTTGGFGVQVKRPNGALEYVAVTPGVFADTWVQLADGAVKAGDLVVVTP